MPAVIKQDNNYNINFDIKKDYFGLNNKKIKCIRNNQFNYQNINQNVIEKLIKTQNNSILETISISIYKNIILKLLHFYEEGKTISKEELQEILINEKGKLKVNEYLYKLALDCDNYEALRILFCHDISDSETIFCRLYKFKILENAVNTNNYYYVKNVLSYEPVNYKNFNLKTLLVKASNNNNLKIMKLLIVNALRNSIDENDYQLPVIKYDTSQINYILNMLIRIGNLNIIKYLVEDQEFKASIDINAKDRNNEYPIITAFYNSSFEIFKYLVEHGANINIDDKYHSLLLSAIDKKDNVKYVKFLLKHKVDINKRDINGNYPLIKAIKKNDIEIVILLVTYANKRNIYLNYDNQNGISLFTLSYKLNDDEIFRFLINNLNKNFDININQTDSIGNNLLYYAMLKEDIETIEFLIDNGGDINHKNKRGQSPLDIAIRKGYDYLNSILGLSNNLSMNMSENQEENPICTIINNSRFTINEKEDIIKKLINHGYKVNSYDKYGKSPLIHAIQKHLYSIVKLLVENGADINYIIKGSNKTVLMEAIENGNLDIVKYLISCNASINYEGADGHSPINWAIQTKNLDILEYLIKSGAGINKDTQKLIKKNCNDSSNRLNEILKYQISR